MRSPALMLMTALALLAHPVRAAEFIEFDPSFLNLGRSTTLDISRFSRGSAALPGSYRVEIWLNGSYLFSRAVTFKTHPDNSVGPCFDAGLVASLPLVDPTLQGQAAELPVAQCPALTTLLPQAGVSYDSSTQRLDITVPQIYVKHIARGSVDPVDWDSGVTAALLGYNLGAYSSESSGQRDDSFYSSLNAGLNIGQWYLRHNGSLNWQERGGSHYDSLNTYLQRDIPVLRGRVVLGQGNTQGQLFDTVGFTGMSLFSDDRMLPESLRGYAPEIRGIARTNARVTVRQNGQVIYETTVTPGAFVINDLYPTGYGGDLDVEVHEADGSEQTFAVPYSSVTQLLRPGMHRYSLTSGKLRLDSLNHKPVFVEATWQQGLTNSLTGYVGGQVAPDYYAAQLGVGLGTWIGAFSADVTQASFSGGQHTGQMTGQSYRLGFSKFVPDTNSNISLATYRFSTRNYLSLQDAMRLRDSSLAWQDSYRLRNRATMTLSQGLSDGFGQLYISGSLQSFWGRNGYEQQYQAGYNNTFRSIAYGVSLTRSRNSNSRFENTWMATLTIPLGAAYDTRTPQLRTQLSRDGQGHIGEQLTLSGTAGAEQQWSYSVDGSHSSVSGYAGTLAGQYRSPWGLLSATWSQGRNYNSQSLGMMGTVIAHAGGINFSPYTGETFALVEAKGAQGASVSSYPGVHIDARGYAIVPNLNPYQMNDIWLDPKGMSHNTSLRESSQKVAPLAGAVVRLRYGTEQGKAVLLRLRQSDGSPVPFGSQVFDATGTAVGYVGQAGQLFARVTQDAGELSVRWGADRQSRCLVPYRVSDHPERVLSGNPVLCLTGNSHK